MSRHWSASWLGSVPVPSAVALGDPFESSTWFSARQHACAVLGLDVGQVEIVEVEEGAESKDINVGPAEEEQVSGVRLRLVEEDEMDPAGVGEGEAR